MIIPDSIWMIFLFALGAIVGSFLNVVVYRIPRELSIVRPGSFCPSCRHPIVWYDNIPILAWFYLGGKCRHCGAGFSIRYALVEFLTAVLFVGLYWAYFRMGVRRVLPAFEQGGWLVYAGHIILLCVLFASSLIDGEHWIIPLSISYTAAVAGCLLSMFWPYWQTSPESQYWQIIPYASAKSGACALGAFLGLIIGIILLNAGLIKRSFVQLLEMEEANRQSGDKETSNKPVEDDIEINIRQEMFYEIVFLMPSVVLGLIFMWILGSDGRIGQWWQQVIVQQKWLAGLLGSVFGFMIGGGVVWATRILGSLSFGREAMGLGDVHLMAAVGAVLGWVSPTIAFFVAPFFGLGWAVMRLVLHRSREIPYGPFLSMGTVVVMLLHDPIVDYFVQYFTYNHGPGP
ncbi:MAG: prepilin peptidase [Sedimentisphaerales bacterium]|nr:prepilin peptidase [Sedimentisphaerales bacterium]